MLLFYTFVSVSFRHSDLTHSFRRRLFFVSYILVIMRFPVSGLFLVVVSAIVARASPVQTAVPQPGVFPRDTSPTTTATNSQTTTTATTTTATEFELTLSLDLPSDTCTPTIKPDKYGWVPASECDALYLYYPSFGAAIAAAVIFGILFMAHFVQATMYKAGFAWVILMGVSWETVAYGVRAFSTHNQQNDTVVTIAQMFVLLAPLCTTQKFLPATAQFYNTNSEYRGQCIRLHGSSKDDPFLRPRASHRHVQTLLTSQVIRLARFRLLRCSDDRWLDGQRYGPAANEWYPYLYGWHRHPGILHHLLFGVGCAVPAIDAAAGADWPIACREA